MVVPSQANVARLVSSFERRLEQDRRNLLASRITDSHGVDRTGFAAVRFIAHRIVGSACIFGCDELAEPAREVERLVEDGAAPDLIIRSVNELALEIERTLTKGLPNPDWTR